MNKNKKLLVFLILLFIAAVPLFAFQISAMEQFFTPTGVNSMKTFTIINDSDDTIAIEFNALTRDQGPNGEEINEPANNYFSILPRRQLLIKPQSSAIVRVQFRGPNKKPANELCFRIKIEQIPYEQGRSGSNTSMFNFLFAYNTAAYVAPVKETIDVKALKVGPSTMSVETQNDDGTTSAAEQDSLAITITNRGTVHQLLNGSTLTVSDSKGNSVTLQGSDELAGLEGINILPKKTITKNIPWPKELSREDGVTYKFKYSYGN